MRPPHDSRVLLLGVVRNVAHVIEREVNSIEKALRTFNSIQIVLLESDSSDETLTVLRSMRNSRKNFDFLSLGSLSKALPNRIDRIAYCRNKLKQFAEKYREHVQYIAVADLDGVNYALSERGILSCWNHEKWDVVTANQRFRYYDVYALRHPVLSPNDCWQEYDSLRQLGFHPLKALRRAVSSRQINIPDNSGLIEVESAFGGFAIYTKEAYFSSSYSSHDSLGMITCEHVTFHKALRASGFRLFINPLMINSNGIKKQNLLSTFKFLYRYTLSLSAPNLYVQIYGEMGS